MSNNPPIVLELTAEEAEFLLKNCDTNIVFGLEQTSNPSMGRPTLEKLVALMEQFKSIRKKLVAEGVKGD